MADTENTHRTKTDRYANLKPADRDFLEGVMGFGETPHIALITRLTSAGLAIFAVTAVLAALYAGLTA